jgi:hypothetical protein
VSTRRSYSSDAHRYLDGGPHGDLTAEELRDADRLLERLRDYGSGLEAPGPALTDTVMAVVRQRPYRQRAAGWRWLFRPQPIRLRPVWVPLAAAAAVALWLVAKPVPPDAQSAAPATARADTVFVRFQLVAPNAETVAVAGSFSDWRADAYTMSKENGGVWSITLPLPVGEHQYQFVIDGERWVPDPHSHDQIDDGFGGTNSVLVVGPRGVVQS